jgi:hypothetical protein
VRREREEQIIGSRAVVDYVELLTYLGYRGKPQIKFASNET